MGELEAAIRTVCEPVFEKPLKDISFGQLLVRLFQTARRFNMEVQPQLVLLEKTLLNVEGLGRQLYPDLDLWSTAQPFLEDWMKDQVRPSTVVRSFKESSAEWLLNAPVLANQAVSSLRLLTEQQAQLAKEQRDMKSRSVRTRLNWRRRGGCSCGVADIPRTLKSHTSNRCAFGWVGRLVAGTLTFIRG